MKLSIPNISCNEYDINNVSINFMKGRKTIDLEYEIEDEMFSVNLKYDIKIKISGIQIDLETTQNNFKNNITIQKTITSSGGTIFLKNVAYDTRKNFTTIEELVTIVVKWFKLFKK